MRPLRLAAADVGSVETRRFAVEELPISLKARIRAHLAARDRIVAELAEVEAYIAADARRLANETGLTVRPRIEQLRHMVKGD